MAPSGPMSWPILTIPLFPSRLATSFLKYLWANWSINQCVTCHEEFLSAFRLLKTKSLFWEGWTLAPPVEMVLPEDQARNIKNLAFNRSSGWAVFVTKGHKITQISILKPNIFWKHVFLKTSSHYFALFATQHFARLAKNDLQQQLAKAKIWLGTIICKMISRMTLQDLRNNPKLQFAK